MRVILAGLVLAASAASASEDEAPDAGHDSTGVGELIGNAKDISELSLADLLDTPIAVATKDARNTRETPAVVTAVSREEILTSGASDLLGVLQLVPGFSFHTDVVGVVGAGFRGLWGHEGKVLLLIDGIEMNDLLYSTTQFGNRIPVHIIERVEVIRGPGSAVYGGNAELAVVNVITRQAKDLQGVEVAGRYAQNSNTYADRTLGLSAGWAFESGAEVALNFSTGQGRRSQSTYTDFAGTSVDLKTTNWVDPFVITASVKYKGLTAKFLYDDYRTGSGDGYGLVLTDPKTPQRFRTLGADVRYKLDLGEHVSVTPYATYSYQVPWETSDPANELYFTKSAQRIRGGAALTVTPLDELSLLAGVEGYGDMAWLNDPQLIGFQTDFQGSNSVAYGNVAAYAQVLWDNRFVNLAVGGRYEWNSKIGSNFAPRIALTKRIEKFHVKLLYSGAFRSPGIENFNLNPGIQAEQTQVLEAEAGLQLSDVVFASMNAFYMRLANPIVFGVDPATLVQTYINENTVGTAGYELELQARGRFGFLRAAYSLAVPTENGAATYQVPGHPESLLGFATHKVTVMGRWRIWSGLGLGGSAVFLSERFGYLQGTGELDADGNPIAQLGQHPATLAVNLWVGYEDLGLKGLSLQVGVDNLLNAPVAFLQPYNGGHAPLYGGSRAGYLRLSYAFKANR